MTRRYKHYPKSQVKLPMDLVAALREIADWPLDPYRRIMLLQELEPQHYGTSAAVALAAVRRYARAVLERYVMSDEDVLLQAEQRVNRESTESAEKAS